MTTGGVTSVSYSILPYNRQQTSDFVWSPDGSKIAYISDRSGQRNIWLVDADGVSDIPLTDNSDSKISLYSPIWSSDGKRIAFTTKTNNSEGKPTYGIRVIDTDSKKTDLIVNENSFIRLIGWAQSGNDLILASVESSGFEALDKEVSLLSAEIATGRTRPILVLRDTYLFNIHLSPDKKTFAFASHREGKDNIWVMPATGGGEARMVTNNNDSRLYFSSMAWSPDGGSIFFGKQSRYSLLSMLTNFQ